MNLNDIHRGIQKNKKRKRVGRGPGSGHGKTASRGNKGQGSRSGYVRRRSSRAGRCRWSAASPSAASTTAGPRRWPWSTSARWRSISRPAKKSRPRPLRGKGLVKGAYDLLKVLGDGELTKSLKISAHQFSRQAAEKIEKAGGRAVVLPGKKPVVKNKMKVKSRQP